MNDEDGSGGADGPAWLSGDLDRTVDLLARTRSGDRRARERLTDRYAPRLLRWSQGRLPEWARGQISVDDLVLRTVNQTLTQLSSAPEASNTGTAAALRDAVRSRIQDQIGRLERSQNSGQPARSPGDVAASPVEAAVGSRTLARYERALYRLDPVAREAAVARVELGASYAEIARDLGMSSPAAARKSVVAALIQVATEMGHED